MSDIYLAWGGSTSSTFKALTWPQPDLNILVSFPYLPGFRRSLEAKALTGKRMLDSGAFSAWNSGKTIDIEALFAEQQNNEWDECVALDVVGNPSESYRNAVAMKQRGSRAYPVFHYGEPWELLKDYCAMFPKVGLSCRFGEPLRESFRFIERAYAQEWPHRFHSFGWVARDLVRRFPFHSVDTASWGVAPHAFGTWISLGNENLSIRGPTTLKYGLVAQVEFYLKLQRELRSRWRKELQALSTSGESATSPRVP